MSAGGAGPQRRITDHFHPEYWTENDQYRYEDKIAREIGSLRGEVREELSGVREEVKALGNRITLILGGLALLAFLLPIAAPFLRSLLGVGL